MRESPSARWGAKIGPRIAMLVVQAIVYSHHKLHAVKHRLAMAIFHSISDEISDEVDVTLGPYLKMLHEMTPTDHPAWPMVNFLHTATGQLKAIVGTGLQASGVLGSLATILNNDFAPFVYNIVKANPSLLPDSGTIVNSNIAGLTDYNEAIGGLAALGIQHGWADKMLALGYNYPALAEGLELLRRGEVDETTLKQWLELNGAHPDTWRALLTLQHEVLSPADLALAVLRGNMDAADGERQAAQNGFNAAQFGILLGNTGEPPGLMQLLEGYRRGLIDKATLERGIKESRYRNEWIPLLEALRYEPMSVADAVNATVQNQMTADEARKIADENGLAPGAFDTLAATAGEPLSRTEMEQLFNRGLVTRDQVLQALRESRLKNKYNDLAFDLHVKLLPEGVIARALRYGEITHDQAVAYAMESGYSAKDAAVIATASIGEKLQSYKDRVVQSAATLLQDNVMSPADVSKLVTSMGYTTEEVAFIVQAAEFHREAHLINTVVSAVKGKYLTHHISKSQASGLLDGIGIPSTQRDYLLKLWEVEHGAYVRVLTPAQITKAVKLNLITADQGKTRLTDLGYVEADATLLLEGA